MLFRVFISLGLMALGYYVGREIGRGEPIRKDLENLRNADRRKEISPQSRATQLPADKSKD